MHTKSITYWRHRSPSKHLFHQIGFFFIIISNPPRNVHPSLLDLYALEYDTILSQNNTLSPLNPPRDIRPSLLDLYAPEYDTILSQNNTLSPFKNFSERGSFISNQFKLLQKQIHTHRVRQAMADAPPPKVLPLRPPAFFPAEESLPSSTRKTISQLRSEYSPFLKMYLNRIDPNVAPKSPYCSSHILFFIFLIISRTPLFQPQ